jgi:diadenosine tetraphosphate (Ap4A) HIT family hydrolase
VTANCVLCEQDGGEIVWSNALARVVNVNDDDHPGFCRVILQRHIREMTDLPDSERSDLMRIVFAVEQVQRKLLSPEKINLASFGNMVAHVHWHVIPRFESDPQFPNPVWGSRMGGTVQLLPPDYWKQMREELIASLGATEAL